MNFSNVGCAWYSKNWATVWASAAHISSVRSRFEIPRTALEVQIPTRSDVIELYVRLSHCDTFAATRRRSSASSAALRSRLPVDENADKTSTVTTAAASATTSNLAVRIRPLPCTLYLVKTGDRRKAHRRHARLQNCLP